MLRIPIVMILVSVYGVRAIAGTCNPLIDGTYCATQPDSNLSISTSPASPTSYSSIQSLGGDLSIGQDQPATLGAITFSGDSTICIGLLRQGACN